MASVFARKAGLRRHGAWQLPGRCRAVARRAMASKGQYMPNARTSMTSGVLMRLWSTGLVHQGEDFSIGLG